MLYTIYYILSKFGGCKRQDSPAKRTPRTNGKFSRRCARHGVRENPESAIGSCVRPCVRASVRGHVRWCECGRECDPNVALSVVKRRCARCLPRKRPFFMKTSLCAVFAAYRVFDPLFVSRWPTFSRRGVVKRRCARLLLKSHSRLRETKNRIKQIDTSRAKRPCEMRSKSGALAYAKRVSECLAYAKRRF